jgi:hypothetical protein
MKAYFTLGQAHTHSYNGITLDKDCVIEIECDEPRNKMMELFGAKWGFEYDNEPPDMQFFPRGIVKIL